MGAGQKWSNIPDPYETLQVSPNAEQEVIEAAYRRLARKYHPDVNPTPQATAEMRDLNRAYEILSNPYQRTLYDQWKEAQTFETIYAEETKTSEGTHPQDAYRPAMRKGKSWWRWPLVLPAFVVGLLVPGFLFRLSFDFISLMAVPRVDWLIEKLAQLTQGMVDGFSAVYLPVLVAPKGKFVVAIVSALVLISYILLLMSYAKFSGMAMPRWDVLVTLSMLIAAGFAVWFVRRHSPK